MKGKEVNKNGFTLVELLAVIAILAILVVMLVPNFIDMFKESKSSIFVTEVQTIMKQAQQEWMLAGGGDHTYKTGDFSLDGKSENVQYYLNMNDNGYFTHVVVYDGNNCLTEGKSDGSETVKMAELNTTNLSSISNKDEYDACVASIPTSTP